VVPRPAPGSRSGLRHPRSRRPATPQQTKPRRGARRVCGIGPSSRGPRRGRATSMPARPLPPSPRRRKRSWAGNVHHARRRFPDARQGEIGRNPASSVMPRRFSSGESIGVDAGERLHQRPSSRGRRGRPSRPRRAAGCLISSTQANGRGASFFAVEAPASTAAGWRRAPRSTASSRGRPGRWFAACASGPPKRKPVRSAPHGGGVPVHHRRIRGRAWAAVRTSLSLRVCTAWRRDRKSVAVGDLQRFFVEEARVDPRDRGPNSLLPADIGRVWRGRSTKWTEGGGVAAVEPAGGADPGRGLEQRPSPPRPRRRGRPALEFSPAPPG